MNLAKLAIRNVTRHKLRSALTILGLAIAIMSFILIRTVISAWYFGVEMASDNRMVTRNSISIITPIPLSYKEKIAKIKGIKNIGYGNWFGGYYKDEKNFMSNFAIDTNYLKLYPEILITPEERRNFEIHRNGCIVGKKLAARFGWKKGDTVRITGNIFAGEWDFVIEGLYKASKKSVDETMFFFRWDYLNERKKIIMPSEVDHVGWFLFWIENPDDAAKISNEIDAMFKNSSSETITETEKAFQLGFLSMVEAIVKALRIVSAIIIVIILVILLNTMAMAARERIPEYATLKAMGFGGRKLFSLILGESLTIAAGGAAIGIPLTFPLVKIFGKAIETYLPVISVSNDTIWMGLLIAFAVGILASLFPAWRAINTPIATSLRKIG
ncbi:MAG: FtsX-like permease family protein [Candidatus Schekmanbacteria bacterium]|nr:FtsX-like permease family protein [Candidatus Schekmanbacteria bacterium]